MSDSPAPAVVWSDLLDRLVGAGATVATAESLTGGRLAARLTDVPGSSRAYLGGVVTYATEMKVEVLRVPEEVVDEHGVVSEPCAREMAEGVRQLTGATYALSTTGVAGPDRQEDKPVGTVFIGLAGPDGTRVLPLSLEGDRESIQASTIDTALSALSEMMDVSVPDAAGRTAEDSALG